MQFKSGNIYHIYNRGNNRQPVFFTGDNYLFFLTKVQKYIVPNCDMLAWCLMPNHFHFLVHATEISGQVLNKTPFASNNLSEAFRLTLSSYTKAINVQENRVGNLFQQKTKSKSVYDGQSNYSAAAFHYIHQNPVKAGLVRQLQDWEYSSYQDYVGIRENGFCNRLLAIELLGIAPQSFRHESEILLPEELLLKIF